MKEKLRIRLAIITSYVEICLGTLLLIALIISTIQMITPLFGMNIEHFHDYLEQIFTLIIGVEALKMIYKHSPGSAIEVLLYTIARSLVVNHGSTIDNLLAIFSILLLFAIRKYLFVPSFGSHPAIHEHPDAELKKESAEAVYAEQHTASIH